MKTWTDLDPLRGEYFWECFVCLEPEVSLEWFGYVFLLVNCCSWLPELSTKDAAKAHSAVMYCDCEESYLPCEPFLGRHASVVLLGLGTTAVTMHKLWADLGKGTFDSPRDDAGGYTSVNVNASREIWEEALCDLFPAHEFPGFSGGEQPLRLPECPVNWCGWQHKVVIHLPADECRTVDLTV